MYRDKLKDAEAAILPELAIDDTSFEQSGSTSYTVRTTKLYAYDAKTKTLVLEYLPNVTDLKTFSLNHFHSPTPDYIQQLTHELGKALAKYIHRFHDLTRKVVQESLNHRLAKHVPSFNTVIYNCEDMQNLKHWINFDWMMDRIEQFPHILSEAKETFEGVKDMAIKELGAPSADLTLIHGDYHPQNVLLGNAPLGSGTTRTLYVIDWENAQVGVPSLDHGGMLGEMYILWKYKQIDASFWMFQGYAEGLGPRSEESAWKVASQVGVHLLSFGTLTSGLGTREEIEDVARTARDVIVKAYNRDRAWFDGSDFACLFTGTGG
ncbi:hypothetical protein F53441_1989 [Fusarium austroafricanum]|uniref:Aminoglycoside phosphotransferase domain-containing protein n=1 Tax=Fusarium austroafricanum TaxID=2364996 RepID=A0A8H4P1M9_9HYPO|nr:hypothetical protein F53441_1989 [Fusarium austroafricanum]